MPRLAMLALLAACSHDISIEVRGDMPLERIYTTTEKDGNGSTATVTFKPTVPLVVVPAPFGYPQKGPKVCGTGKLDDPYVICPAEKPQ